MVFTISTYFNELLSWSTRHLAIEAFILHILSASPCGNLYNRRIVILKIVFLAQVQQEILELCKICDKLFMVLIQREEEKIC